MFEDVRHERSLVLLLSLTNPDILRQSKFTDHVISTIKDLSLEELHRQLIIKEEVANALLESELEKYFLFKKWPIQIRIMIQKC